LHWPGLPVLPQAYPAWPGRPMRQRLRRRQGRASWAWRETWPCPGGRSTAANPA